MTATLDPNAVAALARRSLIDFCELVDPRSQRAPHLLLLAEYLERLERRGIRKLAISMPPRHGKTETISRKFVAWYLGRHPSHHIILASYGSELAETNSREVRSIVGSERFPFDTVTLREDSRSVGRWQTQAGGILTAVGTGSGLTGFGMDLGICDDLVKDRAEAESPAIRASISAWFSDVLRTRAHPNAAMVLVGTRWHEDDIIGEVVRTDDDWTELVLPLIAEDESDALGRQPGQMLWPARFAESDIPSVERGQISSRSFAALYQQRPVPMEGGLFKLSWFDNRYEGGLPHRTVVENYGEVHPGLYFESVSRDAPCHTILAIDTASKTGISNDWSVLATISCDEVDFFVVDIVRERLEFNELYRRIIEIHRKYGHSHVFIEDASSGIAICQQLRAFTGLPIMPVQPQHTKVARAESVTGFFGAKRVRIPERAHWVEQFLAEMTSFPSGKHDDVCDAVVLGITQMERIVSSAQTHARNLEMLQGWMAR